MFGASHETINAAVQQAFSSRGPMSSDELLDVLVAEGIDLGPDAQDLLEDTLEYDPDLFLPLCDDRWAWLPALLDGRIFTHRLSAQEVEHDLIRENLKAFGGNRERTAKVLGIGERTLYRKIKEYDL